MLLPLIVVVATEATTNRVWVAESTTFAHDLRASLKTPWDVVTCGSSGSNDCSSPDHTVKAVVGRASSLDLTKLPSLKLVQDASYFHTDGRSVPAHAAIANTNGFWPSTGVEQIAEWVIAAMFESQYRLGASGDAFRACAFSSDAPSRCSPASTATNHTMVSSLTIGVVCADENATP